jgi:hypothetical protein
LPLAITIPRFLLDQHTGASRTRFGTNQGDDMLYATQRTPDHKIRPQRKSAGIAGQALVRQVLPARLQAVEYKQDEG